MSYSSSEAPDCDEDKGKTNAQTTRTTNSTEEPAQYGVLQTACMFTKKQGIHAGCSVKMKANRQVHDLTERHTR